MTFFIFIIGFLLGSTITALLLGWYVITPMRTRLRETRRQLFHELRLPAMLKTHIEEHERMWNENVRVIGPEEYDKHVALHKEMHEIFTEK